MGLNAAMKVEAEVVDLLPNATVEVKLENQDLVLAHFAGATKTNFVRVRPGDRVEVELSPFDRSRGRIVKLLK
ncbi:MAG: translation initiation factor IF-1 [Acidobacteriaceae bacterium]|nr:translation initiation factor IF-1 [Acidobacteriaceae bacterium]